GKAAGWLSQACCWSRCAVLNRAGSPIRTASAQVASIVPRAGLSGPPVSQENSLCTWLSAGRVVMGSACHSTQSSRRGSGGRETGLRGGCGVGGAQMVPQRSELVQRDESGSADLREVARRVRRARGDGVLGGAVLGGAHGGHR